MPINRRKKEWRKIVAFADIATFYGFESRTKSGDQATLGQEPIDVNADYTKLVIYPNNCQPSSASKKSSAGSSGGLIAHAKILPAIAAGWTVKEGKAPIRYHPTGQNKHIKISMGTVKYAYVRAQDTLSDILNGHGHATPDSNDLLWYGCQFPKPPSVQVKNSQGKIASSLCDPTKVDNLVAAGGRVIDRGCYTKEHLAQYLKVALAAAAP